MLSRFFDLKSEGVYVHRRDQGDLCDDENETAKWQRSQVEVLSLFAQG